ncbi:MAG: hypothetical protein ACHQF3_16345 [Alphaproteobacteria bacterium]
MGASTFGVALLYFYALALSIVALVTDVVSTSIIIASWVVLTAALYYANSHNRQRKAAETA